MLGKKKGSKIDRLIPPCLIWMQVAPITSQLNSIGKDMDVVLSPHSLNCLDLLMISNNIRIPGSDDFLKSSM